MRRDEPPLELLRVARDCWIVAVRNPGSELVLVLAVDLRSPSARAHTAALIALANEHMAPAGIGELLSAQAAPPRRPRP